MLPTDSEPPTLTATAGVTESAADPRRTADPRPAADDFVVDPPPTSQWRRAPYRQRRLRPPHQRSWCPTTPVSDHEDGAGCGSGWARSPRSPRSSQSSSPSPPAAPPWRRRSRSPSPRRSRHSARSTGPGRSDQGVSSSAREDREPHEVRGHRAVHGSHPEEHHGLGPERRLGAQALRDQGRSGHRVGPHHRGGKDENDHLPRRGLRSTPPPSSSPSGRPSRPPSYGVHHGAGCAAEARDPHAPDGPGPHDR